MIHTTSVFQVCFHFYNSTVLSTGKKTLSLPTIAELITKLRLPAPKSLN